MTESIAFHAETNRPLGVMPQAGDRATLDGDTITVLSAALIVNGEDDRPEAHLTVWHDVVGAEARVVLFLTDEAAHVAAERITEGRTLLRPEAGRHLTPLDVLVGDVVYCDAGAVLIDHIITYDADHDVQHFADHARRVAACMGSILSTFPGGPTTRWNVQGNDLRHLSTIYR